MPDNMIVAERIGVEFHLPGKPSLQALDDVSLTVEPGELVAVIGPSGAGKTTLLRCLTGFVQPTSGRLIVDGTDMIAATDRELRDLRKRVATVYQHFNLVERSSAMANVLHGRLGFTGTLSGIIGLFHRQDRVMAYQMLCDMGLGERALQRVDQLSGGERQRVTIARALVQEPVMVLADEPAASLDIGLARQITSLLYSLHRQHGLTFLVNLHDLELARSFATRIIGLRDGSVLFNGRPSELTTEYVEAIFEGSTAGFEHRPTETVA